jgi:hypothetical protein
MAWRPLGPKKQYGKLLVSVKGGKTLNPGMVRDLGGAVNARRAAMGVLITREPATKGIQDTIDHGGNYVHPGNNQAYPKLQHITIGELLQGNRPKMPPLKIAYIPAAQVDLQDEQDTLFNVS